MNLDNIDAAAVADTASKTGYAGAVGAVVGGLTWNEWGVVVGIVIGLGGFLVNVYFKRLDNQRRHAEHLARMRKLTRDSYRMPLDPLDDMGAEG